MPTKVEISNVLTTSSDNISRESVKLGLTQIGLTMKLEFQRNLKKTMILSITFLLFFFLYLTLELLETSHPSDVRKYLQAYLSLDLGIFIGACAYGSSTLLTDFEKKTGFMLFPKITRNRIFIARVLASIIMLAVVLFINYLAIAILSLIRYAIIPIELLYSYEWALLYSVMAISFVLFISNITRSAMLATITCLLLYFFLFSTVEQIIGIMSETLEPIFIPTYYGRIIMYCVLMPDPRSMTIPIMGEVEGINIKVTTWFTPTPEIAAIGICIYTIIFLIGAYLLYWRRQLH